MIKKICSYIADLVADRLERKIENSLVEKKVKEYSIDREIETIHDLTFTQDEKSMLKNLQENASYRKILEKCCLSLSVNCKSAQNLEQLQQMQAGIKALEFLLGELKKHEPRTHTHPLTGKPL